MYFLFGSSYGLNLHAERKIGAYVLMAEKVIVSFTLLLFVIFESFDWNFNLVLVCVKDF